MSKSGHKLRRLSAHWVRRAREDAYAAQDGRCRWCAKPLRTFQEVGGDHPDLLTADHVIPFAMRGSCGSANIVAACRACNLERGRELSDRLQARPLSAGASA